MMNNSLYGNYRTRTFADIFPDYPTFAADVENSKLNKLDPAHLEIAYYLLYARYGNNPIANSDENQFRYKLFSFLFMYGPTWSKRLDVQEKLRDLSEEEIITGSKAVFNHAANPSTSPSTSSLEELIYIDNQSTSNYKKSKLEGYSLLLSLLETDVTEEFIGKFKKLFITVVLPEMPLWYATEEEV